MLGLPAGASSYPVRPAVTAAGCNLVTSTSGSDSASGSPTAPFRTVKKLVSSLAAGETGCLEAGTYAENVTFRTGGTGGAPITLTSYPGETATVVGRMYVVEGANYVTVTGLRLDGANSARLPSPTVDANHVTFSYDDVTNDHTGICFGIGNATWGSATGTLITHDRVHDCGQEVPADNYQHGLYLAAATDTTIEWNLIYDNAARGIQLYPDAQHTTIAHNIIDDNGEGIIISGANGSASSHTNIYDNILSDATARHDVESFWPAGNPIGVDNSVHNNCFWGGHDGAMGAADGFTAAHNVTTNPQFVNIAAHDYELQPASPCLFAVGDVAAAVDGTAATIPLIKHAPFELSAQGSPKRGGHRNQHKS